MNQPDLSGKTALVIGGGKFGAKACAYFAEQRARVLLADINPDCAARRLVASGDYLKQDAAGAWEMASALEPEFIVPACPGHACGTWISRRFGFKPMPGAMAAVAARLPRAWLVWIEEATATMAFSYMTGGKICDENCPHAGSVCHVTGEPRPTSMSVLLEYALFGEVVLAGILVSEQMAPGVGAVRRESLRALLKTIAAKKPSTLAVGTACLCHGALTLLTK